MFYLLIGNRYRLTNTNTGVVTRFSMNMKRTQTRKEYI